MPGVAVQAYCAIVARLQISAWTGRKPTKRACEMLYFHSMGWATEAELQWQFEKLRCRDEQARKNR
jgi:hypothetical protein